MTGPEHYQEAERLLALATEHPQRVMTIDGPASAETLDSIQRHMVSQQAVPLFVAEATTYTDIVTARATAHATLALAAATALAGVRDPDRWLEVAG